jgi:hypothetical protein
MKVAIVYNEPNPEIYKSVKKKAKKNWILSRFSTLTQQPAFGI